MARAHVYRPITDDAGNLLYGATVAVQGDGGVPLGQALYADGTSGSTLPNPYIAASGIVDIWLETPQRLLVTATPVSGASIAVSIDAQPSGDEMFYSPDGRLEIANAGTVGQTLQMVTPPSPSTPGLAQWGDAISGSGLTPLTVVTDYNFSDGLIPGALTFSAVKNDLTAAVSTPVGSASVVNDPVPGTGFSKALVLPPVTDTSLPTASPWEFTTTAAWSASITDSGVLTFWHKVTRSPALNAGGFTQVFVQVQTAAGWYSEPVGEPTLTSRGWTFYSVGLPSGTTAFRIRARHYFASDAGTSAITLVSASVAGIRVVQGAQVPSHVHGDAATFTTVLGPSAAASGVASTAIGTAAQALGISSVALGDTAEAGADHSIAIGSNAGAGSGGAVAIGDTSSATGANAVAIGKAASAATDAALAVGYQAAATGTQGIAVGASAVASGDYAAAVGSGAQASGDRSLALGYQAIAGHDDAVAIGSGASTTGTSQIVLGAATHVVYVPGTFRLVGDGQFGASPASRIGFYGVAGVTQPTVTGSRSGNAALAALLTSLAGTGLIVDSSTA